MKACIRQAKSYSEWKRFAIKADSLEGMEIWRTIEESKDFDFKLIKSRLESLKLVQNFDQDPDSIGKAMFLIRAGMIRNLGGICNARLYRQSRVGTKVIIEEYVEQVGKQLSLIAEASSPEVGLNTKIDFFSDLLRTFGRTALILHGGASFGLCHLGVAKSLHQQGLLPKVVCGTYIGAVMAAAICVQDEAGLESLFEGTKLDVSAFVKSGGVFASIFRKLYRFLRHGCLLDVKVLEQCARQNIGDITFKEAFQKSGRILNIIVQSKRKQQVPVLLNYLTAPDVVVWSAACASCAVPGIYDSVTLLAKCADTGSIRPWHPSTIKMDSANIPADDIPTVRLAELFNVNNVIVSQVPSYFSIQISPSEEAVGWTARFLKLVGEELHHRWQQCKEIGLLPSRLAHLERFFHAPSPGDVTISPSIMFMDILHIIHNPTPDFVQYCLEKGEKAVWKRMCQLRMRTRLEYHMETLLDELKRQQQNMNKSAAKRSIHEAVGSGSGGRSLIFRTRSFEL